MITVRKYTIGDPEEFWRSHAPIGCEDAFRQTAEKYRRQSVDLILESIETKGDWEHAVNKACKTVLRMRRARHDWFVTIMRQVKNSLDRRAVDELMQSIQGRTRQMNVGKWGQVRWCGGAVFKTTREDDRKTGEKYYQQLNN